MWTFKNVFALGLFLFGTTFLWMTASMAGKAPPPTGTAWTLANVLCRSRLGHTASVNELLAFGDRPAIRRRPVSDREGAGDEDRVLLL
jgi:hypothetical protein